VHVRVCERERVNSQGSVPPVIIVTRAINTFWLSVGVPLPL
jgi:hypothetical protein